MSDDDYDDRRRDKFRAERGDRRGSDRYEDDYKRGGRYDRSEREKENYRGRDYDRHETKRRRSPDREYNNSYNREHKRSRNDYDGQQGNYNRNHYSENHNRHSWGGPGQNYHRPNHRPDFHHANQNNVGNEDDILLSFKNWVMKQDDNINEDDACKQYKVYKTEFKKKQMQEFFIAHKDEECCSLCCSLRDFELWRIMSDNVEESNLTFFHIMQPALFKGILCCRFLLSCFWGRNNVV
jgi:hypothetical protein